LKKNDECRLFLLPSDLLPLLFSFLDEKELCCLDSSVLNLIDRPIFLSALIQRFGKESEYFGSIDENYPLDSMTRWYLCRKIPITALVLDGVPCPKRLISLNSSSLQVIHFVDVISLTDEDALSFGQCSKLKRIHLRNSFLPNVDIASIFQTLTNLEDLYLDRVPFSRLTAEIISRHCRSLRSLHLSSLDSLGDKELRLLVEGCSSLRSLNLFDLVNISEESVRMLISHHPQIPSIGFSFCQRVRFKSIFSLLREITFPTIFNSNGDEELQISVLKNVSNSLSYINSEIPQMYEFLSSESRLERLVLGLALRNRVRPMLIHFFGSLARCYHRLVVHAGVIPALVHEAHSFNWDEIDYYLELLEFLSSKPNYQQHLLTSGVLSIFRPHPLAVMTVSE
jgi:hypothetical protein